MEGILMTSKTLKFKFILVLLLLVSSTISITAQKEAEPVDRSMFGFHIGYGITFPGGDLADRFGNALKFSLGIEQNTFSNFVYGIDFDFGFGKEVKEDPLQNYKTENGVVIGIDGLGGDIFLRSRQLYLGALFGKIITFSPESKSGIRLTAGAGLLNHYIRFNDEVNTIGQVAGVYGSGHDRLSRGFALKQQVGYQIHSDDGLLNLSLDFEFTQGFTRQIREYNFDTGEQVTGNRLDLIYGVKLNWSLPLFTSTSSKESIYY